MSKVSGAFHTKKHEDSPITVLELSEMERKLGVVVHGRTIWFQNGSQARTAMVFDAKEKKLVSVEEFRRNQARRAQERRARYPDGRRRNRERKLEYFF